MNKAEEFLDLYRTLEEDLKEFYAGRRVKSSSLVFEYMNEEGRRHYDEIDLCREVRNIISHHSYLDGECPVVPSDSLIEALRAIIAELEYPVTASSVATPAEDLVVASLDDRVPYVLDKMDRFGFSHVPVIADGRLFGVFSTGAVFEFIKHRPGTVIDDDLHLSQMKEYLPIGSHKNEQYALCTGKTTLPEISRLFKSAGPKKKRVAAVFVLKNDDPRSPLCGMITPWDVIKSQD